MGQRIRPSRSGLVAIELVIAVGVFALCAAIAIGLLVRAELSSGESADLTRAVSEARTAAECYKAAGGDLLEIGLRYIRFAEEEPHLFRFLFQTNRFSGLSLKELINAPETAGVLASVSAEEALAPEEAAAFFEPLAALVHGYASFIANNAMKYDPEAIRTTLVAVAEGLERKEY